MEELLNRQDQDILVGLIQSSRLCDSAVKRQAFMINIQLQPQEHYAETPEHSFLVNLIYQLVEQRNQQSLRLILNQISSSGERQKLRYLKNKLNSVSYRPSQPTAKPAYFVDEQVFQLMPLDIGTIWGLQRSCFIGLLISFEQAEIYENLKNVEFVLSQAIIEVNQKKLNKFATILPKREWIRLDINQHLGVPCQQAHIIDTVVGIISNEVANSLEKNSFPDTEIPGFFLDIEAKRLHLSGYQHIKNWCNALLNQLFPSQQVAIIINIIHSFDEFLNKAIERSVKKLKTHLREIAEEIPIELIRLDTRLFFDNNISSLEIGQTNFIDVEGAHGLRFCSWMAHALTRSSLHERLSNDRKKYRDIIDLYISLKGQYSENELQVTYSRITPRDVVFDIAAIAPTMLDKTYNQLLHLIVNFFPQLSYNWVGAYAKSTIEEAIRAALIISTNAGLLSDILMDSWIDAINLDRFNIGLLYQNGGDYPDYFNINNLKIEGLFLALLRKEQKQSNKKIKTLLQELVARYPFFNELHYFCQNQKEKENEFFNQNDPNQFTLAIRAQIRLDKAINQFIAAPFSHLSPPISWLLAGIPPSQNNIIELLQLEQKKRAVFGLCTRQEWQGIKRRQEKEREVLDCRRDRSLFFFTPTNSSLTNI